MPTTMNSTLPNEWKSTITYYEGDLVTYANIIYKAVSTSTDKNPGLDINRTYWLALDIYKKENTIMPHGDYSGDENFWDRDNIYIDDAGWVYVNNENTGINVRGKSAVEVSFEALTPAQKEELRGPQGIQGPVGPQGIQGPQGPMGEVTLSDEQVAALKGDPGKSAYESWLDQGYTGDETDFVAWLRSGIIAIDKNLDPDSTNAVQNKAVYKAIADYQLKTTEILSQFQNRIKDLENRLQYETNNKTHFFKFGVTTEGKYGYIPTDSEAIIPFDNTDAEVLSTMFTSTGSGVSQFEFASNNLYAAPTLATVPPISATSFENDASNDTGEDDSVLYGSNVVVQDFEDGYNAIYHIYKNNKFVNYSLNYHLYNMNENTLTSNNTEAVEGIWFDINSIGLEANEIYFRVEPVVAGSTINYEIGVFSNENASLPSLINGTYRETYEQGSLNSSTLVHYNITQTQGVYFASTSKSSYKITEIYLK